MNAFDPIIPEPAIETTLQTAGAEGLTRVRPMAWLLLAATLVIATAAWFRFPAAPALSSAVIAAAAMAATWRLSWARQRAETPATIPARRRRWLPPPAPRGDPGLISRSARFPQAAIIAPLSIAAIAAVTAVRTDFTTLAPHAAFALAGGAFLLAFPLLIAERSLGMPEASRDLPEAPALRALMFVLLLCLAGTGLLAIAAGLGFAPAAALGSTFLGIPPALIAAELGLRAVGRLFLPPQTAALARAAVTSTVALILAEGASGHGLAAPMRRHLGLDFTRGWAIAFVRAALPAVTLFLLLAVWGMTGIVPVPPEQRAIYERFGAPVRVLPPGLHAILPWPMGRVRPVEFGPLHAMALGDVPAGESAAVFGAEDTPPDTANRLWEQAHPAELSFLIASESKGRQNFQIVSADIKAVWRIGLTDADALHASYAVADPASLARAAAARAVAAFFAGETLPSVLGQSRDSVAERLRTAIQAELDRAGAGIELAAVVIEAVHPPAGAAAAYHAVQAAEITAASQISAERGNAQAEAAKAAQYAADIVAGARGRAAEVTGDARSKAILFTADVLSAHAGGEAFLLDRHLTGMAALAVTPLTIVDHRIPAAEAPMLDLRPPTGQPAPTTGAD